MKSKIKIISFMILFLSLFYSYFSLSSEELKRNIIDFDKKIMLRDNKVDLSFDLSKQTYLLKIKHGFYKDLVNDVSFNGQRLMPFLEDIKRDKIKSYYLIQKNIIIEKNNLEVIFNGSLPKDCYIKLSNYRANVSGGIYLFFKDFNPSLKQKNLWAIKTIALIFIFGILFIFILYIAKYIFKLPAGKIILNIIIALSPFIIFIFLILCGTLFSKYRILIARQYFWTSLSLSFVTIFGFLLIKEKTGQIRMQGAGSAPAKGWLVNLLLAFISLLFIFSLGEIYFRIYAHLNYANVIFKKEANGLLYSLKSNFKNNFAGQIVTTNSQGLRDIEHSLLKPDGVYRVLCLGDSIVFGYGVNDTETFTRKLACMFNNYPKKIEVINLAVPGYNTYQERVFLEKKGLQYHPDLVILGVCLNDITAGVNTPSIFGNLINFYRDSYRLQDMKRIANIQYFFIRHSYFYQFLLLRFRTIAQKYHWFHKAIIGDYSQEDLDLFHGIYSKEFQDKQNIFQEELLLIKKIAASKRADLLVLTFPNDIQLTDDSFIKPQKKIRDFCSENNIPYIRVSPVFKENKNNNLFIDIGHPAAYGHYLIASMLYNYLTKNVIKK